MRNTLAVLIIVVAACDSSDQVFVGATADDSNRVPIDGKLKLEHIRESDSAIAFRLINGTKVSVTFKGEPAPSGVRPYASAYGFTCSSAVSVGALMDPPPSGRITLAVGRSLEFEIGRDEVATFASQWCRMNLRIDDDLSVESDAFRTDGKATHATS